MRFLYVIGFCLLASCGASAAWFHTKTTQVVIADGCRAVMKDDALNNAAMNNVVPYPEVKAAINTAHAAIQAALQTCIDKATQAASTGQ